MKIICVGRNYADHAKELANAVPENPVIFCKPDSAILPSHRAFFIPDFDPNIHHEIELVVKINKLGKHIQKEFAHRYYEEVTVGLDFTARTLQQHLIKNGLPWEVSKGFDGSAVLGEFVSKRTLDLTNCEFRLDRNGASVQADTTAHMSFDIDSIITYVSQFFTLKIGDLIFTGTPAGVGPIAKNDLLEGYIGDRLLLTCRVK